MFKIPEFTNQYYSYTINQNVDVPSPGRPYLAGTTFQIVGDREVNITDPLPIMTGISETHILHTGSRTSHQFLNAIRGIAGDRYVVEFPIDILSRTYPPETQFKVISSKEIEICVIDAAGRSQLSSINVELFTRIGLNHSAQEMLGLIMMQDQANQPSGNGNVSVYTQDTYYSKTYNDPISATPVTKPQHRPVPTQQKQIGPVVIKKIYCPYNHDLIIYDTHNARVDHLSGNLTSEKFYDIMRQVTDDTVYDGLEDFKCAVCALNIFTNEQELKYDYEAIEKMRERANEMVKVVPNDRTRKNPNVRGFSNSSNQISPVISGATAMDGYGVGSFIDFVSKHLKTKSMVRLLHFKHKQSEYSLAKEIKIYGRRISKGSRVSIHDSHTIVLHYLLQRTSLASGAPEYSTTYINTLLSFGLTSDQFVNDIMALGGTELQLENEIKVFDHILPADTIVSKGVSEIIVNVPNITSSSLGLDPEYLSKKYNQVITIDNLFEYIYLVNKQERNKTFAVTNKELVLDGRLYNTGCIFSTSPGSSVVYHTTIRQDGKITLDPISGSLNWPYISTIHKDNDPWPGVLDANKIPYPKSPNLEPTTEPRVVIKKIYCPYNYDLICYDTHNTPIDYLSGILTERKFYQIMLQVTETTIYDNLEDFKYAVLELGLIKNQQEIKYDYEALEKMKELAQKKKDSAWEPINPRNLITDVWNDLDIGLNQVSPVSFSEAFSLPDPDPLFQTNPFSNQPAIHAIGIPKITPLFSHANSPFFESPKNIYPPLNSTIKSVWEYLNSDKA